MKNILGLDLGTNSIGWALIGVEKDTPKQIFAMGSRIVPLTKDDSDQFSKGQAITKNADRTQKRTTRKGYDRYQLRRALLTQTLRANGMLPERMDEFVINLWKLRSDAATPGCQLSLPQIGRVLYHINQKRGYKHSKADVSGDSKQTKYVAAVNQRYIDLQGRHQTIGQYFYEQLLASEVKAPKGVYYTYRTKEQVFPRQAYIAEFDQIMAVQKSYYPDVLTDELIDTLRNRIIFYQRPLKSCKHLVSLCEFEMRPYKNQQGQIVYSGPKCAPRTSPLSQLCAIWETVNKIRLTNRNNEEYPFALEERKRLVEHLMSHEKLTVTDLQKILGISKKEGWYGGKAISKGLKGYTTLLQLRDALRDTPEAKELLKFNLPMALTDLVDPVTGEVIQIVAPEVEQQPLFRLWHIVYSISDKDELRKALHKQLNIDNEEVVERLFQIDFVKPGYANRSHKFMRKILPYLMQGYMYSEACEQIGINHSGSLTKEEILQRPLVEHIPLLQKNQLRQPIVEKILNQMINIVNALKDRYGAIDEIRVELARELKQSKEEREETYKAINKNERMNSDLAKKITEMGIRATSSRVRKYKMWLESNHQCFYCNQPINLTEFLNGIDAEVEHIIPRSVLFDDSFSNKVCACRACNAAKDKLTAMEFMDGRGEAERDAYVRKVDEYFTAHKISKTKRNHLLWRKADIPQDFIDRQLRLSQYIARKAIEILQQICHDVYATSGSVTDFLRHQWGYDEILHTLNFEKYSKAGLTEMVVRPSEEGEIQVERIRNWSKRLDHRHHAIDALTIALTRQGYIQRLNTLNASRPEMYDEVKFANLVFDERKTLLQQWISIQPHFSVFEVTQQVDGILVSFRAGKKVTTPGKRAIYRGGRRVIVQEHLNVPRGALTEGTVYGKVNDKYVVKYKLADLTLKDVEFIIDPTIRAKIEARLKTFGGKAKDAFSKPLYSDVAQTMEIKSVRCDAGLKDGSVAVVKRDDSGRSIGYSLTKNNHHVAIYRDSQGALHECVVTFWDAVMRKNQGLPVVIENPAEVWDYAMDHDTPQEILSELPKDNWKYILSMQINDMVVLGLPDNDYEEAVASHDYQTLNKYLYRVQTLSTNDYRFRSHLDTTTEENPFTKEMKKLYRVSTNTLFSLNPHKVKVNILGEIAKL